MSDLNDKDLRNYEEVFALFDEDGNGSISRVGIIVEEKLKYGHKRMMRKEDYVWGGGVGSIKQWVPVKKYTCFMNVDVDPCTLNRKN